MAPKQPFHAISYNYDTLFEEAVAALGAPVEAIVEGPRLAWTSRRPVDHRGVLWPAGGRPATVRVLHPHGLLPRPARRWLGTPRPMPEAPVILSEQDYEKRREMRGHPMNIAQIEAFGGRRCVFYGLSMQDDWVRALARMANAGTFGVEYPRHLILTTGEGAPGIAARSFGPRWSRELAKLGIARVITPSHDHQKYWLRLLMREVARCGRPLADDVPGIAATGG